MSNINQVSLSGRACADVETRQVGSNTVANVRVASSRSYKDKNGEWQEQAAFVDCEAWGRLAESLAANVSKGTPIYVHGRLSMDEWEQDGKKRSKLKVTLNDYLLLTGKQALKDDDEQQEKATSQAPRRGARSNNGNLSERAAGLPF